MNSCAGLVAIATETVFLGSAVHIKKRALFGSRSLQEGAAAAACRFRRVSEITDSRLLCGKPAGVVRCIIRSR